MAWSRSSSRVFQNLAARGQSKALFVDCIFQWRPRAGSGPWKGYLEFTKRTVWYGPSKIPYQVFLNKNLQQEPTEKSRLW